MTLSEIKFWFKWTEFGYDVIQELYYMGKELKKDQLQIIVYNQIH